MKTPLQRHPQEPEPVTVPRDPDGSGYRLASRPDLLEALDAFVLEVLLAPTRPVRGR